MLSVSEDLEALRLPLEKISISQRQLQLSQWIRYILLSNDIRLNIKLVALIQKNVDKLSAPKHLEKEIEQWFNALKPQGKVDLITESTSSCCLCCIYASSTKSFP
ncbi:hypothetical protein TNCV_3196791 [Trichonephila clavipes]|nr:hypothetical protein TNCV_3196791 [Trichonephila clavipes]